MTRQNTITPLVDLKAQYATIREEVRAAIDRVMDSQSFILGPEVEELEKEIGLYSNCKFGIGLSSGTDALLVALMAIGIQPGDEVITSPYTFFASAGCVVRLGGKPVFVDIDPSTYNIDTSKIESAITKRTRAILPVHLFGQSAEMDPIMNIAERHNLFVIEDAAQAIGSEYKGQRVGSIGSMGCFSFFPSKNLGGIGDGGMVITNDFNFAERVRLLRNHGANPKYYHDLVGGNFRLDAIQAAVLRVKLKYLDKWIAARQRNAKAYKRLFEDYGLTPIVEMPVDANSRRHTFNQFIVRCDKRDLLLRYLREHGIGAEIYYPLPLHLQVCFSDLGYGVGSFLQSERAASQTLALPIYPELTESVQRHVVETIADFYKR